MKIYIIVILSIFTALVCGFSSTTYHQNFDFDISCYDPVSNAFKVSITTPLVSQSIILTHETTNGGGIPMYKNTQTGSYDLIFTIDEFLRRGFVYYEMQPEIGLVRATKSIAIMNFQERAVLLAIDDGLLEYAIMYESTFGTKTELHLQQVNDAVLTLDFEGIQRPVIRMKDTDYWELIAVTTEEGEESATGSELVLDGDGDDDVVVVVSDGDDDNEIVPVFIVCTESEENTNVKCTIDIKLDLSNIDNDIRIFYGPDELDYIKLVGIVCQNNNAKTKLITGINNKETKHDNAYALKDVEDQQMACIEKKYITGKANVVQICHVESGSCYFIVNQYSTQPFELLVTEFDDSICFDVSDLPLGDYSLNTYLSPAFITGNNVHGRHLMLENQVDPNADNEIIACFSPANTVVYSMTTILICAIMIAFLL